MAKTIDLAQLSSSVLFVLQKQQAELNAADTINQNHGDNLVAIWQQIYSITLEKSEYPNDQVLEQAAQSLDTLLPNGSIKPHQKLLRDLSTKLADGSLEEQKLITIAQQIVQGNSLPRQSLNRFSRSFLGMSRLVGGDRLSELANQMGAGALFQSGLGMLQGAEDATLNAATTFLVGQSDFSSVPHRSKSAQMVLKAILLEVHRQADEGE